MKLKEVRRRNPESGLEVALTGLEIDSEQAGLVYRKARFLYLNGDTDDAIEWLEKGIELDPGHELIRILENQLQINND